jgi:biopolymer transport protein ExbD
MGDDRQNSGNGAVVAVVLVLGILVLGGLVLVVGGAMLFWVRSADVQVATMAFPPPVATSAVPTVQASPITPIGVDSPDDAVPANGEAITAIAVSISEEGDILLGGRKVNFDELKARLVEHQANSPNPRVELNILAQPQDVEAVTKSVTELLSELKLPYKRSE